MSAYEFQIHKGDHFENGPQGKPDLHIETPRVPRRLDYLEATISRAAC